MIIDPLTSHILDTVSGLPAANVEATLLKWIPGTWEIIETRYVDIEFDFL